MCGSPPRVWGKPPAPRYPNAPKRFTPTRVGKTLIFAEELVEQLGSPPRVWGKRIWNVEVVAYKSVHPHACGENVCRFSLIDRSREVHPHACGENP